MRHYRPGDEDLTAETRAEIVSNRRGQPVGLRVILPTSILAALVAALGFNATSARTTADTARSTVEDRIVAVEKSDGVRATEIAVIKAQYAALQESLRRIEATLEDLRRERRR